MSYNELEENGFQIECHSSASKRSAEDDAITAVMIEKMLNKLSILNDYEIWLIQELYTHCKTLRQIEEESGVKKSTIWEQKEKILEKLKKRLIELVLVKSMVRDILMMNSKNFFRKNCKFFRTNPSQNTIDMRGVFKSPCRTLKNSHKNQAHI